VLEAVVKHADTSAQALAALFSMAGAETVRETRVEGEVVFRRNE
jgi:hypothetical protein